jgi:Ca2+-binding RTX toxin-like protein
MAFKIGTNAAETLRGKDDRDILDGRGGNDRLFGLGDDDRLFGGPGANQIDGGSGFDLVGFRVEEDGGVDPELQPAARVDLVDGTYVVNGVVSRLTSIEGVFGGEQADRFFGNSAGNWFFAEGGDDTLRGRGGNDRLDDGEGDDIVYGDGGADFVVSNEPFGTDELHAGAGNDLVVPGATGDQAWGNGGADRFRILVGAFGQEALEPLFTIRDFSVSGGDLIDFSELDTDGAGGQEGYDFVGGGTLPPNGTKEVRFEQRGGNTFVQYEYTEQGTPESVVVNEFELSGQKQLTANDFILDFTS